MSYRLSSLSALEIGRAPPRTRARATSVESQILRSALPRQAPKTSSSIAFNKPIPELSSVALDSVAMIHPIAPLEKPSAAGPPVTGPQLATQTMATAKKIINAASEVVRDSLRGLVAVNPSLHLLGHHKVVIRRELAASRPARDAQVQLLSGGGSGHEPSHTGWIGKGMLSGAVCGDVFASPSSKAVLEGIKAVSGDKGALLIVKNYTGDRLNFGRALAKARAEGHVPKIEMVVVADDCGIPRNKSMAGRRGLAGTVFVHKIAGHFAGLGRPLDSVAKIANQVAQNVGTVGFSLSPCSIPGKSPAFTLGPDEIEVALGIHGEAGVSRMKIKTSAELAKLCVDMILSEENDRGYLPVDPQNDDQVVLMVNNLGGTSALEIGIVVNDAVQYLSSRGLPPIRIYAGTFMTSLEMQGVQICLLRVPRGEIGEQFLEGLDGETDAMAWPRSWDQSVKDLAVPLSPMTESSSGQKPPFTGSSGPAQTSYAASMALAVCRSLIDAEPDITLFDQIAGDGDAGNTIAAGASAVIEAINGGKVGASGDMSSFIRDVSAVCEDTMGGSFGAVLCIFLDTVAGHLREHGSASPTTKELADAVLAGTAAARHIGGANPGDRTMVDALVPFAQTLRESLSLEKAATAAKEGAEFTKTLRSARLGRASYLVGKTLDVPDPGAHAVAVAVLAAAGVKA